MLCVNCLSPVKRVEVEVTRKNYADETSMTLEDTTKTSAVFGWCETCHTLYKYNVDDDEITNEEESEDAIVDELALIAD